MLTRLIISFYFRMITDQVMDFWNDLESLELIEKSFLVRIMKSLIKLAFNYFTFWIMVFHGLYYLGFGVDFRLVVITIIYCFF